MGILDESKASTNYFPVDFSQRGGLRIIKPGVTLSDEILISFDKWGIIRIICFKFDQRITCACLWSFRSGKSNGKSQTPWAFLPSSRKTRMRSRQNTPFCLTHRTGVQRLCTTHLRRSTCTIALNLPPPQPSIPPNIFQEESNSLQFAFGLIPCYLVSWWQQSTPRLHRIYYLNGLPWFTSVLLFL